MIWNSFISSSLIYVHTSYLKSCITYNAYVVVFTSGSGLYEEHMSDHLIVLESFLAFYPWIIYLIMRAYFYYIFLLDS